MLSAIFSYVGVTDVLDVIATSVLIYYLLLLIRGTRAVQILMGILVLVALLGIANVLHLYLLVTILQLIVVGAAVTIPIVFQPELRRALEQIGRGGLFRMDSDDAGGGWTRPQDRAMAALAQAAFLLSRDAARRTDRDRAAKRAQGVLRNRYDARRATLGRVVAGDFMPRSPLHDGAAIVREERIVAAGCFLPLAEQSLRRAGRDRNAPSRGHRHNRADRRGRRRRIGRERARFDRARRQALAPGRRGAATGKDAARRYASAAPRSASSATISSLTFVRALMPRGTKTSVQIIRRNFTLKLLALSLAIVGWAYFRFAANPIVAAARFAQQISVPIVAVNLPTRIRRALYRTRGGRNGEGSARRPGDQTRRRSKPCSIFPSKGAGVYNVPVALVAPASRGAKLEPGVGNAHDRAHRDRDVASTRALRRRAERNERRVGRTRWQPRTVSGQGPTTMLAQVAAVQLDVALPSRAEGRRRNGASRRDQRAGNEVGGLKSRRTSCACKCTSSPAATGKSKRDEPSIRNRRHSRRRQRRTDAGAGLSDRPGRRQRAWRMPATASARSIVGRDTRLSGHDAGSGDRRRHHVGRIATSFAGHRADARRRLRDATRGSGGRRDDQRLAQPDRRQRHQVFRPRRIQAVRRDRKRNRVAARFRRISRDRPARASAVARVGAESRLATTTGELYESGADLHGLHVDRRRRLRRRLRGRALCVAKTRRDRHGTALRRRRRANQRRNAGRPTYGRCKRPCVRESTPGERRVVGVAFDGDADRALFVDETAKRRQRRSRDVRDRRRDARREASSTRDAIVGTMMSNIGFERALRGARHRADSRAGRRPLRARSACAPAGSCSAASSRATSSICGATRPATGRRLR